MRRVGWLLLLLAGCGPDLARNVAGAAVTTGVAVAAAAVNRAATDECWGQCSNGYRCDTGRGICVPEDEITVPAHPPADPDDDGCIEEEDGRRVCPDDPVAGGSDLAQLLALAIERPTLASYYHVDEAPDRRPLRILRTAALTEEPSLAKFGEPVIYVDPPSDEPHLELTAAEITGDRAHLALEYPVEGLVMELWLVRDGSGWRVEREIFAEE